LTPKARALLHEWVQSDSLRKHCEAVAACMGYFARKQGAEEDLWTAVALLHDMDYERHPNLELSESGHPFVGVRYLREQSWGEEVTRAILAHAFEYSGVDPVSPMEKTLVAVDELSGFVTAVALVRPDKSVMSVEVSSVRKKMKDKAFARGVSRDDVLAGAADLGVDLDEHIDFVVGAMRGAADSLGLGGVPQGS
jgi:putative nucleotidyltransferase with HDIG domain